MGRHKSILTTDIQKRIDLELKNLPNSEIHFRLTALKAATTNNQEKVASIFAISRSTLQRWGNAFKNNGIEGLKNKPKGHKAPTLSEVEKEILKKWILTSDDNKGKKVHWTLKRLVLEISTVFGKKVGKTPLWLLMKKMGLSLKKPRPKHYKSNKELQESFKKNSRND